jgi:hypothetical protein
MNKLWKLALVAAAVLALAGVAIGVVAAQTDETATPSPTAAAGDGATATPEATAEPEATPEDDASKDGEPTDSGRVCGFGHFAALDDVAGFLGLSADALRDRLAGGESLAQVAEAQGSSRDELKQFLLDRAEERVAEKVAEGRIDQAEADEKLERFSANLDELIDREGLPEGRFHRHSEETDDGGSTETTSLTI